MRPPKLFKPFRGFSDSPIERKSRRISTKYTWRSRRYSNWQSDSGKLPFKMSGEFRANRGKLATREKLAQQVLVWRCTPVTTILCLPLSPARRVCIHDGPAFLRPTLSRNHQTRWHTSGVKRKCRIWPAWCQKSKQRTSAARKALDASPADPTFDGVRK
jgi:hypothetical protein